MNGVMLMYLNNSNIKSKIFFGTRTGNDASDAMNAWLEQHPNVEILEFKYQHTTTYWHHSICILYRERKE